MNGATYHVTTPAQLERHREEQRRAEERVAHSVERTEQLTRAMCAAPAASMSRALSTLALAALVACGGGGGGGGGGAFMPVAAAPAPAPAAPAPVAEVPAPQPEPEPVAAPAAAPVAAHTPPLKVYPNSPGDCTEYKERSYSCPLVPGDIGRGIPPASHVRFINNTGEYLQIDEVQVETGETGQWGEVCVYLDDFRTGQNAPGVGEVGCTSKQIGENYRPIRWGSTTGLSVAPGGVVYMNSSTAPAINHTFALKVRALTAGVQSWRAPQHDAVIPCDGHSQSTAMTPQQNTTGRNLTVTGATLYAEAGYASNTLNGPACLYVMKANGSPKYAACDMAFRSRGEVEFDTHWTVEPGEWIGGQGVNTCAAGAVWGWSAFLRVW